MPKPSPLDDLATSMAAELASDTAKLAGSLKAEIQQVGTETMTKAEYLAYVHRNWADATFRTSLLKQIGNKPFLDLAQDVVAAHGHPDIPPMLDVSGMLGSPTMNSAMYAPAARGVTMGQPPPLDLQAIAAQMAAQPGGPRVG